MEFIAVPQRWTARDQKINKKKEEKREDHEMSGPSASGGTS